ncbi:MAG: hypothetical protein DI564_00925 [Rhodanobacter denitrificans]|uniref:OmpR/PhoB-type domain-containing protein n=1 Tax=Rhodanobacter denitrificans TaxID=666685 RepID=A0A2W5MIV2_9GAMM|nr:MAG: hypothetical protein DI564_00925 [Rhodanobacter denitrificans]
MGRVLSVSWTGTARHDAGVPGNATIATRHGRAIAFACWPDAPRSRASMSRRALGDNVRMRFSFGLWTFDSFTRDVDQGGVRVAVPRRVFDCLIYLIEHRDRAVGRDELVAAVWGRVDVADVQVSQLIARSRRLIGDDAQSQHAIRTVAGFGYRWVMPLASTPEDETEPPQTRPVLTPGPADDVAAEGNVVRRPLLPWLLAVLFAAAVLAGVLLQRSARVPAAAPADTVTAAREQPLVVLPLAVEGAPEAVWIELGAMDLIADRLRRAGLPVPSSESVLAALHEARRERSAPDEARLAAILGSTQFVRGRARPVTGGWEIVLQIGADDGPGLRVEAVRAEVIDGVQAASAQLLAALGHAGDEADGGDPDERAQRIQAAVLAGRFDTARDLLDGAPETARASPRLRLLAAEIAYHGGDVAAAREQLAQLAERSDLDAAMRLRVLIARGMLALREDDCASAERSFDAALSLPAALRPGPNPAHALAGRGLARSCLERYAAAADDLGLARLRFEAAGDRLGIARADNYLGLLDARRRRGEAALKHFESALATYDAFGVVDAQRAALSGILMLRAEQLQWHEALGAAGRLGALRARVSDPVQRRILDADRARALVGVGRYGEAEALLAGDGSGEPGEAAAHLDAMRADLAWRRGQPELARQVAARALAGWPPHEDEERRAWIAWIAATAADAKAPPAEPAHPLQLLAAAQRATRDGDRERAESQLRDALAAAEARATPATVARVAIDYVHWLLDGGRSDDAAAVAGRITGWAERDFDCALLRVALFHARGEAEAWARALAQARALAGERAIPAALQIAPAAAASLAIH